MEPASEHYVREKLAGAPRDLELALAFVPAARRTGARLLQALRLELEQLAFGSQEPNVVLARTGWWREEWERLAAGRPRHPLTRALGAHGAFAPGQLDPVLAAVLARLQAGAQSTDAIAAASHALGDALGQVEAAFGHGPAATLEVIWTDVVRSDWLLALGERLAAGTQAVPLDVAAELQLTRRAVLDDGAAALRLLAALAPRLVAERPLRAADASVYGALRRLRLHRRLAGRAEPGPFRCLAAAWGAARAVRGWRA